MNHHPTLQSPIWLARNELARLGDVCGSRLECTRGTVWITLDRQLRDVVLEAGESFTVDSHDAVLVNALRGPAELALGH